MDKQEPEKFIHTHFGYCFYALGAQPIIYNLYVYPEYRQQGNSRMLLQSVIGEIKRAGYNGEIYIQAAPREDSIDFTKLIRYYESLGLAILDCCKKEVNHG